MIHYLAVEIHMYLFHVQVSPNIYQHLSCLLIRVLRCIPKLQRRVLSPLQDLPHVLEVRP